jgi:hypothetical protein
LPGGFENGCVSGSRLGNNRVYFFSIAGVVGERDPAKSLAIGCNIRILSKFVPWAQGKGHPSGLKGHDTFGLCHGLPPSQTFIEFPAALQVCHAKRDDAHRLFHQLLPAGRMYHQETRIGQLKPPTSEIWATVSSH